jgi:hypothetical protein
VTSQGTSTDARPAQASGRASKTSRHLHDGRPRRRPRGEITSVRRTRNYQSRIETSARIHDHYDTDNTTTDLDYVTPGSLTSLADLPEPPDERDFLDNPDLLAYETTVEANEAEVERRLLAPVGQLQRLLNKATGRHYFEVVPVADYDEALCEAGD